MEVKDKCLARVPRMSQVRFSVQVHLQLRLGLSVSETPAEHVSVKQSPLDPKMSERVKSDTLTERISENPNTTEPLNLDNYVTKEEFDHEISKRDKEIISLKARLQISRSKSIADSSCCSCYSRATCSFFDSSSSIGKG